MRLTSTSVGLAVLHFKGLIPMLYSNPFKAAKNPVPVMHFCVIFFICLWIMWAKNVHRLCSSESFISLKSPVLSTFVWQNPSKWQSWLFLHWRALRKLIYCIWNALFQMVHIDAFMSRINTGAYSNKRMPIKPLYGHTCFLNSFIITLAKFFLLH